MIKSNKLLAIVLCLLLCIQSFVVLANNQSQNLQTDSMYPEVAVKLGILDSSIMTRLNSNITRGELVSAIVHMRGIEGVAKSIFSDVNNDHPYAKEISAAYDLGYINGFGDGTFRPDEDATYSQALKLLVYLAGYEELIENGMTVESVATKAKISRHFRQVGTGAIKVSEAAEALVNVGSDVEVLNITSVTDGGNSYAQNGDTIFNAYLNIYVEDAIVTANAKTGIYEEILLGDNMIMLDSEQMIDSSSNASELLGCNVTAYVRRTKGAKPELLYAHESIQNKTIKIPASKLTEFKDGVIYYEDEKGDDEEISIKLSSVATIYNGVLTITPSASDFDIETGSLELIDNDNNGTIDVAKIQKYENYIIDTYDSSSNTLWFKFGGGLLKLDELEDVEITSSNNKPVGLSDLFEWDVLSIAKSKRNELVTVIYIAGEVEGEITGQYNKEDKKIEIDGKTYNVANIFMDNLYDEVYIGQYANFYLDIEGKIASYNLLGNSEKKFCYLIGIVSGSGLDKNPQVKLMDELGNIKILPLASGVELDGIKKSIKNESDLQTLEALSPQVIIGKINDSGKLTYIDTVGGDDDGLRLLSPNTEMQYKRNTMVFYKGTQLLSVSAKTIYFYVPLPGKKANDDDYYINKISGLSNNDKFTFSAYTDGDGIIADAILRTHNPESGPGFPAELAPAVVNEISKVVNDDGDPCYKFSVFNSSGNMNQYYTESDQVLSGLTLNGESYFPSKGDVVKITTNRYGKIRGVQPVYCAKSGEIAGGSNPSTTNLLDIYRVQAAYAYKKDDHFVMTTTTKPLPEHLYTTEGLENLELKNLSTYKVCVYDSEKDLLTAGSDRNVFDFIGTEGLEASKMFIFERYLETGMVCIYR